MSFFFFSKLRFYYMNLIKYNKNNESCKMQLTRGKSGVIVALVG